MLTRKSITRCSSIVIPLLKCYGLERLVQQRDIVCVQAGNGFLASIADQQLRSLPEHPSLVTKGIPIALIEGKHVKPLLGLLSLAERLDTAPTNHYVIVSDKAWELFTYGRDILPESILKAKIDEECRRKRIPVIVVSTNGSLAGFGAVSQQRGRLLIRNLVDLGWYLRSGV